MRGFLILLLLLLLAPIARAEPLSVEDVPAHVFAPMMLGEAVNDQGVHALLNAGGGHVGYAFTTQPIAPLPGFSGAAINILVVLDLQGQFLDVKLLEHNEPIFVSGLGDAPFHGFFEQYRGLSISDSLVVGTPYGGGSEGSGLVYLDGVTKATASVRIAHETILAASLAVAREKMGGVSAGPPAFPNPDYEEPLTWADLIAQGIVTRQTWANADLDAAFAGTLWSDDDAIARAAPDQPYLDLWVVDLGPPAVARAVLSEDGYRDLQAFLEIAGHDEPILVIDTARHGLVSADFVRNTAPNWIAAAQGGFPISLRDADLLIELNAELPDALHEAVDFGQALILRTDRRLGFDPSQPWTLSVSAVREHGVFQPEIGTVALPLDIGTAPRFFTAVTAPQPMPAWLEALRGRAVDLAILIPALLLVFLAFQLRLPALSALPALPALRLGLLAGVVGFVGWWGQGQLSIVTPLGVLQAALAGGGFGFLVYDPFSLALWAAAILGFVLWGRGLFCGWLCPFGALQEFASKLATWLRIPQITVPPAWDARLKWVKYGVLAALVGTAIWAPEQIDLVAEVEPFKTA
ncbi:MAG: 4Fe-4S binding protein, partial [Pseudomonadota bacterium]